ncbi:hypothetical protein [Tsukamurella sp. NPDC003166]|uniref:hypothetical protein n=1 Tax=Tsukamurella sp. NPDC003166 TaxID=3154444 RepID=UPI0033BD93E5
MSGSHRTSTRGVARRRATLAAGAVVASAGIALAPVAAAGAATAVDPVGAAENGYATWGNVIRIASANSAARDAVLGVAAKPLPTGWAPTSTTTAPPTSVTQVPYLTALTQAGTMVISPADTSGVPGIPGLAQAGTLPAQVLLGEPILAAAADGAGAATKIGAAWGALNLINGDTLLKNSSVNLEALGGTIKVIHNAGTLTGIPSVADTIALLPSGTRTTTNWSNTVAWPLLQTGGTTWLLNDRLDLSGLTSQQVKDALGKDLNDPDGLVVEKGTMVQKTKPWKACSFCPTIQVPDGPPVWTPTLDEHGDPVRETRYDPSTSIPGALANADGIDIPGFSVIKKGAGGTYFLPGDGRIGWLGQTTQVIVPAHGGTPAKVATVPIVAGGVAAPFGLLTAGGLYTPGILTQSGQSLDAALGSRSFGLAIPRAGLGVQTTSFLESWHVGPDGVNVNTGWTVLLPQTGTTGIPPIPLVFSLGSYNAGPKGFGFTSPSLFGIGLPNFQVGTTPASGGGTGPIGNAVGGFQLPTTLISLDPKVLLGLAGITDPTGLGLTDPFGTAGTLLTGLYQGVVTPIAEPLTQAGFDVGGQVINSAGKHAAEGSGNVAEIIERVSGSVADTAEKIEPVVPAAPPSALDDVTIEPAVEAVGNGIDTTQSGAGSVLGAVGNPVGQAPAPASLPSGGADSASRQGDGAAPGSGGGNGEAGGVVTGGSGAPSGGAGVERDAA